MARKNQQETNEKMTLKGIKLLEKLARMKEKNKKRKKNEEKMSKNQNKSLAACKFFTFFPNIAQDRQG